VKTLDYDQHPGQVGEGREMGKGRAGEMKRAAPAADYLFQYMDSKYPGQVGEGENRERRWRLIIDFIP